MILFVGMLFLRVPSRMEFSRDTRLLTLSEPWSLGELLLFPSIYDSSSNTIFEAYQLKCLVLIYENVGHSELFPEISICKSFNKEEWKFKLLHLLNNYSSIITNYNIKIEEPKNILNILTNLI